MSNRKQRVVYEDQLSNTITVNIGVPQGSILGPLLFLIYFNDFCNVNPNGNEILFADDATVYEHGSNYIDVIARLNSKLIRLSNWLISNRLSANIIKTEGMIFSLNCLYFPLPPLMLYGNPFPYTHTFKLLGVIMDTKLTWKAHIKLIQSKLARACGILYAIRNKVTRSVARMIYLTIAYPHLIYCNVVWGGCYPSHTYKLETIQRKIIRIITKRNRYANTDPLFNKLNVLKIRHINELSTLVFVFKTLHNLNHSPIQFNHRIVHRYRLRNNDNNLEVPFARHRFSQLFISIRGPNLWNSIPIEIRRIISLNSFKRNLKRHYIQIYGQ